VIASFADTLFVPLEALFGDDTLTYVYRTNNTRRIVVPSDMNENYRIIDAGLDAGDEIYLSKPDAGDSFKLTGEEYIPALKERALKKQQEEEERKHKPH
jgi:hypothetical protein